MPTNAEKHLLLWILETFFHSRDNLYRSLQPNYKLKSLDITVFDILTEVNRKLRAKTSQKCLSRARLGWVQLLNEMARWFLRTFYKGELWLVGRARLGSKRVIQSRQFTTVRTLLSDESTTHSASSSAKRRRVPRADFLNFSLPFRQCLAETGRRLGHHFALDTQSRNSKHDWWKKLSIE